MTVDDPPSQEESRAKAASAATTDSSPTRWAHSDFGSGSVFFLLKTPSPSSPASSSSCFRSSPRDEWAVQVERIFQKKKESKSHLQSEVSTDFVCKSRKGKETLHMISLSAICKRKRDTPHDFLVCHLLHMISLSAICKRKRDTSHDCLVCHLQKGKEKVKAESKRR
ncbi:hypothetical protein ACFX10_004874 [Malus domestica]